MRSLCGYKNCTQVDMAMFKYCCYVLLIVNVIACTPSKYFQLPFSKANTAKTITGTGFYKTVVSSAWQQRDSVAVAAILAGNIPDFLKRFVRINTSITDSNGKTISAYYFVSPDYVSIGTNDDWARIPLTPMAAQIIADSLHCFLPTRKMVDDIYTQATVKLEPVPMYAFRDSSITMWQHHLIIEGQRKGKQGLIAGIKKDVVLSGKTSRDTKPNREAIYGWHKLDGKPIQPLYTGHINWWVDYSHGIRLVYQTIWVNGQAMHYTDVLKDVTLQKLLCDEAWCDCYRY